MDIDKITVAMNAQCSKTKAIKSVMLNGKPADWSIAKSKTPVGQLFSLKVVAPRLPFASFSAKPSSLCLMVAEPCVTLRKLCTDGVCRAALFDSVSSLGTQDGGCCPSGQIAST